MTLCEEINANPNIKLKKCPRKIKSDVLKRNSKGVFLSNKELIEA